MEKLSVLIFSKGYVHNVIALVRDVYDIAGDIVLIDQSSPKEQRELHKLKESLGLSKLSIFHAVSLGYPDPLRMYALKKCRNRWVLLIDTDERLSDGLRARIRNLIGGKPSAFALKRYEEVKDSRRLPVFFTWQIRLFMKDMIEFRGIPHEQPIIKGELERLDDEDCYMMHMSELMSRKTQLDYEVMEKFERLTYGMYRKKMLEYLTKAKTYEHGDVRKTASGKALNAWMGFYQTITMKKEDQELSNFDYFAYYSMLDLAYFTLEGNIRGIIGIVPREIARVSQIRKWKDEKGGDAVLDISKIVNSVGITKFLALDDDATIARLTRKYSYRDGGIKLLMKLIYERYNETKKG